MAMETCRVKKQGLASTDFSSLLLMKHFASPF
jgi:hypothetical protein